MGSPSRGLMFLARLAYLARVRVRVRPGWG
jgi:hypothetical protein